MHAGAEASWVGPKAKLQFHFMRRARFQVRQRTPLMTSEALTHVLRLLDDVLALEGRALRFTRQTSLLGSIPEMDSMAVVSLMTAMEEQLGITIQDDDIDGDVFATVGSLTDFVAARLQ